MKQQGMVNSVMSAIIGGVIGAGVVFFAGTGNNVDLDDLKVANLTVETLTITGHAELVNEIDGEMIPVLALRDGSLMAENVIFARKLVGTQLQGHAIVANRLFTTPDNLFTTPMEQWRFYAEIGSSIEAGGELVVRSAAGPALVNRPTLGGALLRVGFDTENQPQMLGLSNFDRSEMRVSQTLSAQQRAMIASANPQGMIPQGSFDGSQTTPIHHFNPNSDVMQGVGGTQPVATGMQDLRQ